MKHNNTPAIMATIEENIMDTEQDLLNALAVALFDEQNLVNRLEEIIYEDGRSRTLDLRLKQAKQELKELRQAEIWANAGEWRSAMTLLALMPTGMDRTELVLRINAFIEGVH